MSDGERVRRGGGIRSDDDPDRFTQIVAGFEYCPVVVRRHDVESFWTIPSQQRQRFFFDYLRDLNGSPLAAAIAEREKRSRQSLEKLQQARARLTRNIAETKLPDNYTQTRHFLNHHLLPLYGEGQGRHRRVPGRIYRPFVEFQNALKKAEEVAADARADAIVLLPENRLRQILDSVSLRVSQDFAQVVGGKDWIQEVSVTLDDRDGLDIRVVMPGGRYADPAQVLNEAALDVLALLILVEVHVECTELGQRKLIVLDDVFQSVDSVHRVRCLDHVMGRLQGWQIVLTLHDRLWLELARAALLRLSHVTPKIVEIRGWSHNHAPELRRAGNSTVDDLSGMVTDGVSPGTLTAIAGRALEQLCDRLSVSIGVSVTRRKDDKYTLGDLWPGVRKALSKSGIDGIRTLVESVDMSLSLRNLAGAHYNAWADTLTQSEAEAFADSVVLLWRATSCATCGSALSSFRPQQGANTMMALPCRCTREVHPK